jgi:hypothetical protein
MRLLGAIQLALADVVSADQERGLAALLLGLVAFAAVFVLLERRRSRRGEEARKDAPEATADPPAPKLYQPPLTNPGGIATDPMPDVKEPVPSSTPTEDHTPAMPRPASPDEIGIVMPDDEPPPAPPGPPPAG